MTKSLQAINDITFNLVSFGYLFALAIEYMPIIVGLLVGISIAALNIARIITEIKKWKNKKKNDSL